MRAEFMKPTAPAEASEVPVIKGKITTPKRNDAIPDQVWRQLQANGATASSRLEQLLQSQKFDTLKAADQANLIRLALEYAYGKPALAPKAEVKVRLGGASGDAVSLALTRLAGVATLPEHRQRAPSDADDHG